MAIRLRESPDSRELHYGAQGGGQTLKFTVIATAGETEAQVYSYALANTPPYFNGFIKQDVKVVPQATPLFTVEVEYGTTGVGGGDQPLGGVAGDGSPPPSPTAPAGDSAPLPNGWSFSITAPRVHITQSLARIAGYLRGGAAAAPDFAGKIGYDPKTKKVDGCDVPPEPAFKFSRTWARANVTLGYFKTLAALAGRTNNAAFYGFEAGEVLLLSANGQGTEGEKWSITAEFGVAFNEVIPIDGICDGLPAVAAAVPGWSYKWILDTEVIDEGVAVIQPRALYIEKVCKDGDFAGLEIGA